MPYSDSKSLKKKTLKHPKADDTKRTAFTEQLIQYQQANRPIIYLDESGFKSNEYRPYAYTPKDQKYYDTYNWQLKNLTNAILWLPPYSLDLNPIENTWAWVKQKRRDWRLGCVDSLFFYFMWICTIF